MGNFKEQFASKNITAVSFNIMNIAPDEKSREVIAKIDKMKELSKLSPEVLHKMRRSEQGRQVLRQLRKTAVKINYPDEPDISEYRVTFASQVQMRIQTCCDSYIRR